MTLIVILMAVPILLSTLFLLGLCKVSGDAQRWADERHGDMSCVEQQVHAHRWHYICLVPLPDGRERLAVSVEEPGGIRTHVVIFNRETEREVLRWTSDLHKQGWLTRHEMYQANGLALMNMKSKGANCEAG
jgi:hypothetical protein